MHRSRRVQYFSEYCSGDDKNNDHLPWCGSPTAFCWCTSPILAYHRTPLHTLTLMQCIGYWLQCNIQIFQPFQSPKLVSTLTASHPTALPQPQLSPILSLSYLQRSSHVPLILFALSSLQNLHVYRRNYQLIYSAWHDAPDERLWYGCWGGLSVTDVRKARVGFPSLARWSRLSRVRSFLISFHEPRLTSIYIHVQHAHTLAARRSFGLIAK